MSEARLVKHMSVVNAYRERLAAVQGSWDTLSLLSHLGGSGSDMTGTRAAFEALATTLLDSLAAESRNKSILGLKSKAQIAVDIIVRNLYERTADIGFLCADDDLKEFVLAQRAVDSTSGLEEAAAIQSRDEASNRNLRQRMHQRLREYVAKYSVYQDVIVLDLQGRVLLQLDSDHPIEHSQDPLIAETLAGRAAYVETFRRTDLVKHQQRSLIYSGRIMEADRVIGVLCLSFRFEDEVAAIFANLQTADDWIVLTYLDAQDEVIATSDAYQIPLGAKLTGARAQDGDVIRFAGREFLAVTCATQGYQGYAGPGWQGHALLPLEHAFDRETQIFTRDIPAPVLAQLRDSQALFSQALQKIPQQAQKIQRELNRSVWNGNIALAARSDSRDDFSKVLLREIASTGIRTQGIFESSIAELHETVLSKVMEDARQFASLALDILDRNLYERANDCRWWALNSTLRRALGSDNVASTAASAVLRQINDLYTVYDGLVLFDADGRIVAVSNPTHATRVGERIDEAWVQKTLCLRDSQSYAVSSFAASTLYHDRHTFVFGAAIRGDDHKVLGGIGIVFDREAQLSAMLQDALPHTAAGSQAECIAVFVDDRRQVVAATSHYQPGDAFDLPASFAAEQTQGVQVMTFDGTHYAIGFCTASGYREFAGLGIHALIMIPLGPEITARVSQRETQPRAVQNRATQQRTVDIATFYADGQWLGVRRDQIVAAIDAANLRSIPARPAWHVGVLLYQETPVPVIDVARFTGSARRSEGRDVIVLRDDQEQYVGLLVDQLADISEIEERQILPVKGVLLDGQRSIIDHAVRPSHAEDPVLFILDIAELFAQVRSATATR